MPADLNAHDTWRDHAALYALDALDASDRAAFERHLHTCAACAEEVRSLRPVVDALAQAAPQHEPPAALRDRVMAVAGARPEERRDAAGVAPSRQRSSSSVLWWLATAAMVAVIVGLAVHAATLRTRVVGLEADLQSAVDQLEESRRLVNAAQLQLASTRSSVDVLMAPDTTRVDLAGQAPAPAASGRAYWSPSRGVVLSAANLPPLQPSRTYQLWFLTAGSPVSAGLLTPDASGRVAVAFEPTNVPQPIGFAVSEEPAGGVPQPTGELYLAGRAD